ncbi:MAG: ribosome biogenesis GTPase Der [Crocinitomicaceae bacterium]|nr:ribosome biogenesis GTPase Der [Crocinitomicaceae bacterium]
MNYTVAIVGRPNVGKSTLFNRLTETAEAIVEPTAGVTRDRKYGEAVWQNKEFIVVDTGGVVSDSSDEFEKDINNQVRLAIEEADLILFVVDAREGITEWDEGVAGLVRRSGKRALLAVNKVDTSDKEYLSAEFYSLGIGKELYAISANNGYGTGDLMDAVTKDIPAAKETEESDLPKIAIVGRPNVGKSTLLNTLLGEERSIVSEVSGTTRDSVHTVYNAFGKKLMLVDTAGLRKRKQIENDIEYYSTIRTIKTIRQSDVCMLLMDATEGVTRQDLAIFGEITEANKGVVILVNKWDIVEKNTHSVKKFTEELKARIAPFTDVPVFFTSNVTRQRILKALEAAVEVAVNRKQRISTSKLNDIMLPIIQNYPPPVIKGKEVRIKFVTQLPTKSPAIAFFCNTPQNVKEPYQRFLENKLRENFNFSGIPVRLYFRQK